MDSDRMDFMGYMKVNKEDLDIIFNQPVEDIKSYIKNAEKSLEILNRDRNEVPDIYYGDKEDIIEQYKKPFTLFCKPDPGATHYRMSIYPYAPEHHVDILSTLKR